ncbi:hypothetical protein C8Q80DRAFT_508437 [Daedaleopsis nitida]|nr:hypothetical protein C8Q80DRAFT_508437 [Daedaleopsis nitida]
MYSVDVSTPIDCLSSVLVYDNDHDTQRVSLTRTGLPTCCSTDEQQPTYAEDLVCSQDASEPGDSRQKQANLCCIYPRTLYMSMQAAFKSTATDSLTHKALTDRVIVANIVSYAYWGRNLPNMPLDLRTVLAFGLTCRALLDPALDQLWRRQLNIFNLYKTLPEDVWEIYDGPFMSYEGQRQQLIRNKRVIIPRDWPRFDYYATKIRELGYDPYAPFGARNLLEPWRKSGVPMMSFMALLVSRVPFQLIPNVRRVRWTTHEYMDDTYMHVCIFLNPPLLSIKLDFSFLNMILAPPDPEPEPEPVEEEDDEDGEENGEGDDGDEGGDGDGDGQGNEGEQGDEPPQPEPLPPIPPPPEPVFPEPEVPAAFCDSLFVEYTLKAILEQSLSCREIELTVLDGMEFYRDAIKDFIRDPRAHTMRTFAINLQAWQEEDLVILAGLRDLRKTRVYVADTDCAWMSHAIEAVSPRQPFARLVDLTLHGVELECCTAFFILWGACWLERLVVCGEKRPEPDVLHTFVSTLAASCSTSTLRALTIADCAPPPPVPPPADAGPEALSAFVPVPVVEHAEALLPLVAFTELHEFGFEFSDMRSFTNTTLAALVSSWPRLELLCLGPPGLAWGGHPSALTFAGLSSLVRSCRHLEALVISIDTTQDHLPGMGVVGVGVKLEGVDLTDSYVVEDPLLSTGIARSLAALFPELVEVSAWAKRPEPEEDDDVEMGVEGPTDEGGEDGSAPAGAAVEQTSEGEIQWQDRNEQLQDGQSKEGEHDAQDDAPPVEDEQGKLPPWLASAEFWQTVQKQIATFALLRDMGVAMDMS